MFLQLWSLVSQKRHSHLPYILHLFSPKRTAYGSDESVWGRDGQNQPIAAGPTTDKWLLHAHVCFEIGKRFVGTGRAEPNISKRLFSFSLLHNEGLLFLYSAQMFCGRDGQKPQNQPNVGKAKGIFFFGQRKQSNDFW